MCLDLLVKAPNDRLSGTIMVPRMHYDGIIAYKILVNSWTGLSTPYTNTPVKAHSILVAQKTIAVPRSIYDIEDGFFHAYTSIDAARKGALYLCGVHSCYYKVRLYGYGYQNPDNGEICAEKMYIFGKA